ncbi:hypothetical protein [Pseudoalteromonas luteoviolacea]|uniref:hypothetical protein n=1 Tax=Pseudoalteromonas luteoviolacea TaxID=43657 RepID=UPI0011508BB5|nr:hypothetical protein [Pseudoalteromonas luteoviolacea]TQF67498.1 hypothetical protein FLM44_20140 [Pseudoalteromonas luteoviolacea]
MRQFSIIFIMLCILSTQVFGSVAYDGEHKSQGDSHSLLHEIGQPHSHDHDDETNFTLSFSKDAIEHINQDLECCITAIVEVSPLREPAIKPSGPVILLSANWSPPFLKHSTPPPRAYSN